MEMSRGQAIGVVLIGALLCSLAVTAVAADSALSTDRGTAAESPLGTLETEAFDADRTRFEITVFANGSAKWVFHYEQRLESDEAIEDFETYAERFNTEETDSYQNFRTRSTALAASGSDVTDREMTAVAFTRNARVEERPPADTEFAIVEMSFVWTGFAATDDDRVVVGDVFVDGLYVGPDQQLRFERGPSLRFESVSPEPDSISGEHVSESETITWVGEKQFTDRQPRVVYGPQEANPDPNTEETSTESGIEPERDQTTSTPSEPGSFVLVVILAFVLAVTAIAVVVYRNDRSPTDMLNRRRSQTESPNSQSVTQSGATATNQLTPGETESAESVRYDPKSTSIADDALLSDEERVLALLEEQGGRMKQVKIVKNTEWSKSKVSMLLSEMEEDGLISKLRVGRENIVSLIGHEPDAAGSPFDDE